MTYSLSIPLQPLSANGFLNLALHVNRIKSALIVVHRSPDVDAIGSALSLFQQLERRNVNVKIWSSDYVASVFSFLPDSDKILQNFPRDYVFDTLFVLDSSSMDRIASYEELIVNEDVTIVNIDHHKDNTNFGTINLVLDVSSVGELLSLVYLNLGWSIDKDVAICLYAAISYDTGHFMHSNVTAQTYAVVTYLMRLGINAYYLTSEMYDNKDMNDLIVLKLALDRMVFSEQYAYVYTTIPLKFHRYQRVKIVDVLRQLKKARILIVFSEIPNGKIKISFRSKDSFDVQEFAMHFGGGGHKKASGVVLKDTLSSSVEKVTAFLEKVLEY